MAIEPFEFVPFGNTVTRDPYPWYERMREAGDILRTSYGALIVHRYDHVRQVHGDHAHFSMSVGPGADAAMGTESLMAGTMLMTDPPDHERLRRVVNRAFTPSSITALEPRVRQIARELLAPVAAGDAFDIVADFAAPLPAIVIAELLGVPKEDSEQFRRWSEVVTGTDMRRDPDPAAARQSTLELRSYLRDQIDRRRSQPTDDLIGRMVEANRDRVMTDDEVVASCVLLLVAGNETTMRLITNMTLALGRNPDQLERLVESPELVPTAVEETLRYDSPVQMLYRGVKDEAVVGDEVIPVGQPVLTMLAAANHDPAAFKDPDVYDVARADNPHVSFGHGIHYCLGAPLARRETRIAFEEILQMAPRFRVLTPDDQLEYPPALLLRSPRSLTIRRAA